MPNAYWSAYSRKLKVCVMSKDVPVFFIAGVQRSGTTLLSFLLGNHPDIHVGKNSVVLRLITCINNYRDALPRRGAESREELLRWLLQNDYRGRLAALIDVDKLADHPDLRSLMAESLRRDLERNDAQIWGDKAPNLQHFIPELLHLFPRAKVLHIVRDGRAVAYSNHKRAGANLELSAQEWVNGNILGQWNRDIMGADHYQLVRYEDLVREPEKTARELCAFLGLAFRPEMMDLARNELTQGKDAYVAQAFDVAKINQFREALRAAQIQGVEKIQGPLLRELGYELTQSYAEGTFRQLSVRRQIWLHQKNNLRQLFLRKRSRKEDWQKKEGNEPWSKRWRRWLVLLGYDFLSRKIYYSLYRDQKIKNKYFRK